MAGVLFGGGARNDGPDWYRVQCPARWLGEHGVEARTVYETVEEQRGDFEGITTFVAQRGWHPTLFRAVLAMKARGMRVVYELDDDVWSIPSWNPLGAFFTDEVKRAMTSLISVCDAVAVTTTRLGNIVARMNGKVRVVPNAIPWDLVPERSPAPREGFRIGWAGSNTHSRDLAEAARALARLREIRRDVTLVFLGAAPTAFAKGGDRVEVHPWVGPADYYRTLAGLDLDVFVAPLEDHRFNYAKSPVKVLEAGAMGCAIVASDVGPYECLRNGETGLKVGVNLSTRWQSAIQEVLSNHALRARLQAGAREWVRTSQTMDHTGPLWAEVLGTPLSAQKAA